jgi:protein-S-isoprenylcysteine O-methyltransferase Ste14
VRRGPYRFTRNPMYLGMTVAYVGFTLVFNTAWPLVLLLLVMIGMHRFVIRVEEAYLTELFGQEYAEYRRRVRRWI